MIPIIYAHMPKKIHWPSTFNPEPHFGTVGAIDCTPHFHTRIHPGSLDYYCGDLKDYFLSAQVVISLKGELWSVFIRQGHHNDQGIFNSTEMKRKLRELGICLLGDLGYHSARVISPRDTETDKESLLHRKLRAIVERLIGYSKCWDIASGRCVLAPELQEVCLIVYQLVAAIVEEFPLVQDE